MTQKVLTYAELGITMADVYEAMGYKDAAPDEATRQETLYIINKVSPLLRPQFCYSVMPSLPAFDMGKIIARQLRGSEAYALFVATAGVEFEAYQQQLKEQGDLVRVFIADALGTVIAEKCADRMEETLQTNIDKLHWHHTNRFSPGYCGWPVSQQQMLFSLLPPSPCGVQLTASSLMVPIKSVSGIVGLGREVRRMDYTCGLCDMKHCYKRKTKE